RVIAAQRNALADLDRCELASRIDSHFEVGEHDGEETRRAREGDPQGRRADRRAAEELERARTQRRGEQAEALVGELAYDRVVQRRIRRDWGSHRVLEMPAAETGDAQHPLCPAR